jgi:hypothetical protein
VLRARLFGRKSFLLRGLCLFAGVWKTPRGVSGIYVQQSGDKSPHSKIKRASMYLTKQRAVVSVILLVACCSGVLATPPREAAFKYPVGRHEAGELRYVSGVPVLLVAGTPEEMGEQVGVLALRPARKLMRFLDDVLKERGLQHIRPLLIQAGKAMLPRFPEHQRREMAAMSQAAGVDKDLLTALNTIDDLERIGGCSSIVLL